MGEKFDEALQKAKNLSYNKKLYCRLLDDLGTAYLSTDFNGLDKSLMAVKTVRKLLTSKGYSSAEIDDYLLEHSYLSKSRIRQLRNESIYNEDCSIRQEVEIIPMLHDSTTTTDKIIDGLKSRPEILRALKKGISKQQLTQHLHVNNAQLLINFYNKHRDIIETN